MMIDFVSGIVEATHGVSGVRIYDTGYLARVSPDGELERLSSSTIPIEGSHDNRLIIRSPRGNDLYLSGNPNKYFQGHNLFGSANPIDLFFAMGVECRHKVGLFPSVATWDSLNFIGPRFTRLDVTRSYRFDTPSMAREWIRSHAATARTRHGAASVSNEATVYFGKNSTRWGFKFYHKADELKARAKRHHLSARIPYRQRASLMEWAQGVVRFELTLRGPELQKISLQDFTLVQLWQQYFDRVDFNENATMSDQNLMLSSLSPRLQTTFHAWRSGADLRSILSTPTFYRHRSAIKKATGVDISNPPAEKPVLPDSPGANLPMPGWDPEPLEGLAVELDPDLAKHYLKLI